MAQLDIEVDRILNLQQRFAQVIDMHPTVFVVTEDMGTWDLAVLYGEPDQLEEIAVALDLPHYSID